MLPRHAYLSATMLALAATMSEEDSPVVPSPEPDDGATLGREGPESHWSSVLGRAILDDMRADEDAVAGAAVEAKVVAAFPHMQPWGAQEPYAPVLTGYANIGQRYLKEWAARDRQEQREHKKQRTKRKARKGWA